jgi:squalene-hopene/tetraprenyl-beta-curcumene cyclase
MRIMDNKTLTEGFCIEADLDGAIERARDGLLGAQKPDGHFIFELEADATIPAEYILMTHYLGEPPNAALEHKMATYLRRIQGVHGGWPLYYQGAFDMSASVKAYFALKMAGDPINASHMRKARAAILGNGGAARSNVFTRILLALYGEMPWRATPMMPVELMLAPRWFPFRLGMMSYWARTVLVPLLVICDLKPRARNPRGVHIDELFVIPPDQVRKWQRGEHQKPLLATFFEGLDQILRHCAPYFPSSSHQRAIQAALDFVDERLNGEDGLGAIFPAMVNSVLMYDALAVPADDPRRAIARQAIDRLIIEHADEAYCQPCVSPVWDTALSAHALLEVGDQESITAATSALQWLLPKQILDVQGDWAQTRPTVRAGGWAFQYANPYYPDLDDTAVIVMALHRSDPAVYAQQISRASEWLKGLQSSIGGWAAFDVDNNKDYLNHIPFADHGALLDPPTADLTARCISMLAQLEQKSGTKSGMQKAIAYLLSNQEENGSWFGRWGMNYIYGTWSALCALSALGPDREREAIPRAAAWLKGIQNPDGGWGEAGESYALGYVSHTPAPSTASQTAWALLGLMAAGETKSAEVDKGVSWLLRNMNKNGGWDEPYYTATGFPRVFYLRYHGYARYFPLWALARYRNIITTDGKARTWGM